MGSSIGVSKKFATARMSFEKPIGVALPENFKKGKTVVLMGSIVRSDEEVAALKKKISSRGKNPITINKKKADERKQTAAPVTKKLTQEKPESFERRERNCESSPMRQLIARVSNDSTAL